MKKAISLVLAVVFAMSTCFALAGCGSEPKTLEDYLADNASAAQEIEESLSGLENGDMGVDVSYDQNKITITCELKTTYEDDVLEAIKGVYEDSMDEQLASSLESAVAEIEKETGIEGVSIDIIVNNGDGTAIWQGTYPKADAAADESSEGEDSEAGAESEE